MIHNVFVYSVAVNVVPYVLFAAATQRHDTNDSRVETSLLPPTEDRRGSDRCERQAQYLRAGNECFRRSNGIQCGGTQGRNTAIHFAFQKMAI